MIYSSREPDAEAEACYVRALEVAQSRAAGDPSEMMLLLTVEPAVAIALVVGAVIVTVALPEVASEVGETEHVVPGKDAGTAKEMLKYVK